MKDPAYQAVCNAFGRYFEVHPTSVHAYHHLRRDWGLDSSELTLIAAEIEQTAGVELDDPHEYSELETVGQLAQLVRSRMLHAAPEPQPSRLTVLRAH
jgi:acyl carrier protein